MVSVVAKLGSTLSVVCTLGATVSCSVPLSSSNSTVVAELVPAQSVVAKPVPALSANPTGLPGPERNVLLFLIDDSGREFLETYSNETYTGTPITSWLENKWGTGTMVYPPTPNISDLAANGVVLTRFNTSATCSPTRAALLTGRDNNAHKLGNAIRQTYPADPVTGDPFHFEGTTIYKWMEQQGSGYLRLHIGKWHISESFLASIAGLPLGEANSQLAFQRPVDVGRAHYYAGGYMNWRQPVPGYDLEPLGGALANHERWTFAIDDHRPASLIIDQSGDSEGSEVGIHGDEFIMGSTIQHSLVWEVARANEVIDRAKTSGRPFLMNVWFHATHDPLEWSEGMGGAQLSASGYHSYGTSDPGEIADRFRAFTESVDHAIGLIVDNLTAAQRANTTIIVMGDNGIDEQLIDNGPNPTSIPSGGNNPYDTEHSKRAPWQGGIGSPCIINGPDVVSPGLGTTPRFWDGLCDVQDMFYLVAAQTGTHVFEDQQNGSSVLQNCLNNVSTGKDVHIARAFLNGYADDMFSEDQGTFRRWVSAQNAAGWKLIWFKEGSAPTATVTWEWQLYDMPNDPLEATDIFAASKAALGGTPTIQAIYNNLTSGQKTQFNMLYLRLVGEDLLPPGMEVTLS